jgi:alkanesulfonate monooxygenase SsuD/methylene tetrahydromethanopterin reductase-like flavin-dependent oxidoreductase (luciferase family)
VKTLRFGLWYDFRTPTRWPQDPSDLYAAILDQIVRAEDLGWDDVWLSEHHFIDDGYLPSCLPMAAAIAARTRRMRIGTAILQLPLHDPVRLAEDAAIVDVISRGRLDLGVGLGYRPQEYAGFDLDWSTRVERLEEGLEVLRALFAGEALDFSGRHYRLVCDGIRPLPVQRPLPILLGAIAEPALRRAARLGHLPHHAQRQDARRFALGQQHAIQRVVRIELAQRRGAVAPAQRRLDALQ